MIPPVPDGLFAKPCMEPVERHGKILCPFLLSLLITWSLIEEGALLGIGGQAGQAHRHLTETDSTTDASLKERSEVRSQVHFPTRLRHPFPFHHFNVIAVADREGQTSTDPSVTAQHTTEPLEHITELPHEDRVINLIRLQEDGVLETRLTGLRQNWGMIDPLRPSSELTGIVADGEFECLKRTLCDVPQREEVEIVKPIEHPSHRGAMESWQSSDRERRHQDALRPVPDIVEFRGLDQGRGGLRDEFVTADACHTIEVMLLQDLPLCVRGHITGRAEQPSRPCQIHDKRPWLRGFPDRCIVRHHAQQRALRLTDAIRIRREDVQ